MVDDFVRRYSFVAQLFTFGDAELEMMYELCRNLCKKLPREKTDMPTEILDYIDLSSIAIARGVDQQIGLTAGDSELDPMGSNLKMGKSLDEKERLSLILKGINETYGIPAELEESQLELFSRLRSNEDLKKIFKHNDESAAKEKFNEIHNYELLQMYSKATKLYEIMEENKALKESFAKKLFEELYLQANAS